MNGFAKVPSPIYSNEGLVIKLPPALTQSLYVGIYPALTIRAGADAELGKSIFNFPGVDKSNIKVEVSRVFTLILTSFAVVVTSWIKEVPVSSAGAALTVLKLNCCVLGTGIVVSL